MIKFDDLFSQMILNNTDIFENIHPNCITLFGVGLNIAIFYYLFFVENIEDNLLIIGIMLFLRWLADCLDGNVARKYKKTSKLGNVMDSASDILFLFIIYIYLCKQLKNTTAIIILTTLYTLYTYHTIYENKIFETHENIKQEGGLLNNINSFFVNNTFINFIVIFFVIKYSKYIF
jgi:phosphatidylglycerophosphate synthase